MSIEKCVKNINQFLIDDTSCIEQLRMDRHTFYTLCRMLKNNGHVKDSRNMLIEEKVALFLNILAHDEKTRIIKYTLKRSEETINRNFHKVLKAMLHLHEVLFKIPEPVLENCEDNK